MPSSIRPLTASSSSTRRADRGLQSRRRATVRLPRIRGPGSERQRADALPYHQEHDSYLQRFLATGDARVMARTRSHRPPTGWHGVPAPSLRWRDEDRRSAEIHGHAHDLTERVWLEGELGSSEARWKEVIDSAVDGIIVIDAHGRVEAFNPAAERLFGYSATEVLGRNLDMLMPSPYPRGARHHLPRASSRDLAERRSSTGREVQGSERRHDVSAPFVGRPDHSARRTEVRGHSSRSVWPRSDGGATPRAAALAKLGEMAAVIAHEVKNPLAGIRGAIQVLGDQMAQVGPTARAEGDRLPDRCARPDDERSVAVRAAAEATTCSPISSRS